MDILHVAPELAPLAKVGGLADVVFALSKQQRLMDHRVTLVLPLHRSLKEGLSLARRLSPLTFEHAGKPAEAKVYDGRLPSGVEIVALELGDLFDREGIYGERGEDYPDNPERFALFSRAAAELAMTRPTPPTVVHAHDWPTALVPYFLKARDGRPRTVLTLHNLAHQGVVAKEKTPALGISWDDFRIEGAEFYGKTNVLKLGIVSADVLTTVSETYARDILGKAGMGLEGVLGARKDDLHGIPNGIDQSVWNPATDVQLVARYDAVDATNKARCKGALLGELGLDVAAERPLFVFVGRLVHQKGIDLVVEAAPKMLSQDATLVVLGEGDAATRSSLEALAKRWPGRFALAHKASESLVHRAFAAADFALVPSRFEPCGLVQLYAQRYGALPVATRTGGLADSIVDLDAELETGTGFLFDEPTAASLLGAFARARTAYTTPRMKGLVARVMRLDRGWERPARRVELLYRG